MPSNLNSVLIIGGNGVIDKDIKINVRRKNLL